MKFVVAAVTMICFIFSWFGYAKADQMTAKVQDIESDEIQDVRRLSNLIDYYVTESFLILDDQKITRRISQILEKISNASDIKWTSFKARVINDPSLIAASSPGYIYVSTGLLDILETEDELAAVLALKFSATQENYQFHAFESEYRSRKLAFIGGFILAAGALVGGAAIGAASAASTASLMGPTTLAGAMQPALYQLVAIPLSVPSGFLFERANALPDKKVICNRVAPYFHLPSDMDFKTTIYIFFKELYEGYEGEKELKDIELASNYLIRAGYKTEGLSSVLTKLLNVRSAYLSKGYISNLLISQPGLEGKIGHVNKINNK